MRGTLDTWDPLFLDELAKNSRIITVDYPGRSRLQAGGKMSNAHLVIHPESGHGPQHQYPERAAAQVADFLRHAIR